MRTASNQLGHAVHRLDGPIGGVAITETRDTRAEAEQDLAAIERTPGAEYRVEAVLEVRT